MSDDEKVKEEQKEEERRRFIHLNIRDEQFWFTATTLAVNGFFISTPRQVIYWSLVPIVLTFISIYAIFLIAHRHAELTKTIKYPGQALNIAWKQKFVETCAHIKIFPSQLWLIACELSGSFFYILVLLLSLAGVWVSAYNTAGPLPKLSCSIFSISQSGKFFS